MKRPPDDDIIEGIPVEPVEKGPEDEDEPTRTLDTPRRREVPPNDRRQETSQGRGEMPSVGSLVESEEALRVFDEMSKPDGSMSTYPGSGTGEVRSARTPVASVEEEESRILTLPPHHPAEEQGEPITLEVSFAEIEEVEDPGVPAAPAAPFSDPAATFTSGADVDASTQREAWQVFENCPCPLFRLDGDGRLQLANRALCQFLGAKPEEILGKALHRTRLGRIYPDIEEDLDGCLVTRSALQRVVSYQASEQQSVRFLLWIVPFPRSAGRSNALSGIILPYPGEGS